MPPKRGGGGGGGGNGLSKVDSFFQAVRSENIKTLHWSLRHGGFGPTKPYEDETQLPAIHLAVQERKLKSLKCILEVIDRLRDSSEIIDYREDEQGRTPLMVAASIGWKDGCFELLRNDASITAKDDKGLTAIDIGKTLKKSGVADLFTEWLRDDDAPVVQTQAMLRKMEDIEKSKAKKAEEEQSKEQANIQAKHDKFDAADKMEEEQKAAAAMSNWDEVKEALDSVSTEVRVQRQGDESSTTVDPTLWKCSSLKILRLRMAKSILQTLPPDLGQLINLTELIVSHNSLQTLPAEIGLLVQLRALEAEDNCLESLPAEFSCCTKMEVFNVATNKLTSLAPISSMPELLSINASQNELTTLDFELEQMVHLRVLAIMNNKLAELPSGIGALTQMTQLLASDNELTDLPAEMGNLSEKKLITMELNGNKFKDRKIKQILEKSVKPVKELTNHLKSRGGGGGGGGGGKKKKKK